MAYFLLKFQESKKLRQSESRTMQVFVPPFWLYFLNFISVDRAEFSSMKRQQNSSGNRASLVTTQAHLKRHLVVFICFLLYLVISCFHFTWIWKIWHPGILTCMFCLFTNHRNRKSGMPSTVTRPSAARKSRLLSFFFCLKRLKLLPICLKRLKRLFRIIREGWERARTESIFDLKLTFNHHASHCLS